MNTQYKPSWKEKKKQKKNKLDKKNWLYAFQILLLRGWIPRGGIDDGPILGSVVISICLKSFVKAKIKKKHARTHTYTQLKKITIDDNGN